MNLSDLFEFRAPRTSVIWPVNKTGTKPRVERSEIPTPKPRTSIRTRKDKNA